jgi:hypothetical protein
MVKLTSVSNLAKLKLSVCNDLLLIIEAVLGEIKKESFSFDNEEYGSCSKIRFQTLSTKSSQMDESSQTCGQQRRQGRADIDIWHPEKSRMKPTPGWCTRATARTSKQQRNGWDTQLVQLDNKRKGTTIRDLVTEKI